MNFRELLTKLDEVDAAGINAATAPTGTPIATGAPAPVGATPAADPAKANAYRRAQMAMANLEKAAQYSGTDEIVRYRMGLPAPLPAIDQWDGKMPAPIGRPDWFARVLGTGGGDSGNIEQDQTQAAAQNTADAASIASAQGKLKELNDLIAKIGTAAPAPTPAPTPASTTPAEPTGGQSAAPAGRTKPASTAAKLTSMPSGVNPGQDESVQYDIANQLLESFGYAPQLDEYSMDQLGNDASDFGRGMWHGATLGAGSSLEAGAKSLVKGTKYKDELKGAEAAEKDAEKRSPYLYGAGDLTGAVGSSMVVPGAGVGNLAARGAAKLGAGAATQAIAKGAAMVGGNLAVQKGVDVAKDAINAKATGQSASPAGTTAGQYDNLPFGQAFAAAKKAGVPQFTWKGKPYSTQSATESIASLRAKLAVLETTEEEMDEALGGAAWDMAKAAGSKFGGAAVDAAKGASNYAAGLGKSIAGGFANPEMAANISKVKGVPGGAALAKAAGATKTAGSKTAGAFTRNPGKTALGTAAVGYGLSQLGGKKTAPTPGPNPGPNTGPVQIPAPSPVNTTNPSIDPVTIAQIQQIMSDLSQYNDPEIQQGLAAARAALDKTGALTPKASATVDTRGGIAGQDEM